MAQITHAAQAYNPAVTTGGFDKRAQHKNTFMGGANPFNVRDGTMVHETRDHPLLAPAPGPSQSRPQPQPQPHGDAVPRAPTSIPAASLNDDWLKNTDKARFARRLQAMDDEDPEAFQKLADEQYELAHRILQRHNPHQEVKIKTWVSVWYTLLKRKYPDLSRDRLFHTDVVHDRTRWALRMRTLLTKGRSGAQYVTAVTLHNWLTTIVYCIVAYCHGDNGEPDGVRILVKLNLFDQLQQEVLELITELDLQRYPFEKLYYGETEVLMIIRQTLHDSENGTIEERIVAAQHITVLLIIFFASLRAGTVGTSCQLFLDQGKFIKLKDLRFYKRDKMTMDADVRLSNWKGYNMAHAILRYIRLCAVVKSQNVLLCVSMWLTILVTWRRGFEQKTMEEVMACPYAELKVLPEKAEEPLFLPVSKGGHRLVEGKVPATASAISAAIRHRCLRAGLPVGTAGTFRRGSANDLGIKLGNQQAKLILNHADANSTFEKFYSRGTHNVDLVNVRLAENFELTQNQKASLRLHDFTSSAVVAMVTRPLENDHISRPQAERARRRQPPPDQKEAIAENPEYIEAGNFMDATYTAVRNCFQKPAHLQEPKRTRANYKAAVNKMMASWTRIAVNEDIQKHMADFELAHKQLETIKRKATRQVRQQSNKAARQEGAMQNHPLDTSQNRLKAVEALPDLPGNVLNEYLGRPSPTVAPSPTVPQSRQSSSATTWMKRAELEAFANSLVDAAINESDVVLTPSDSCSDHEFASSLQTLASRDSGIFIDDTNMDEELDFARNSETKSMIGVIERSVRKDHPRAPDYNISKILNTGTQHAKRYEQESEIFTADVTLNHDAAQVRFSDATWLQDDDISTSENMARIEAGLQPSTVSQDGTVTADGVLEYRLDDNSSGVKDYLGLSPDLVRQALVRKLEEPLLRIKNAHKQYKADGNKWICHKCKNLHAADPDATKPHPLQDISKLFTHLRDEHSLWRDLPLDMVKKNAPSNIFSCPSVSCEFKSNAVSKVRAHCVSETCPDHVLFRQLKDLHDKRYPNYHHHFKTQDDKPKKARAERTNLEASQDDIEQVAGGVSMLTNMDADKLREIARKGDFDSSRIDSRLEHASDAARDISRLMLTPGSVGSSLMADVPIVSFSRKDMQKQEGTGQYAKKKSGNK